MPIVYIIISIIVIYSLEKIWQEYHILSNSRSIKTLYHMKKLFIIPLMFVVSMAYCQEFYITFEFMKVEDKNLIDYLELEEFWSKIHQEGINDGAYTGWDLWSLKPGGQEQGYQYLVVTVFDDMKKMLSGSSIDEILARAKKAYPDLTEEQIREKTMAGSDSRSRGKVLYCAVIDGTEGEFNMPLGTIATVGLMKASNNDAYVKAEREVFKPMHQKSVNDGLKGSWSLARIISPTGSETFASHFTVNMYEDVDQYLSEQNSDFSNYVTDWDAVDKGLLTREMRWVYMATLEKKLR